MSLRILCMLILWVAGSTAFSQCPVINVSVPPQVCIGSNFQVQNTTAATSFEWDFCPFDLTQSPTVSSVTTLTGNDFTFDLTILRENNQAYGFAVGRSSSSLLRLDFGSDVNNIPAQVNLGNPGGLLNSPNSIAIVKQGATWFGLMVNEQDKNIVLLNFGNTLTNAPTASILTTRPGTGFASVRVAALSPTNFSLVISEFGNSDVYVVSYGLGLLQPSSSSQTISLPGSNPIDVSVTQVCGSWYAFVIGFTDQKLYRMDFTNNFSVAPAVSSILPLPFSFSPYRFALAMEGATFYGFVTDVNGGGLARVDIGANITATPTVTLLGNGGGLLSNSRSLWMDSQAGSWNAFMVNGSNGQLNKLSFQKNCNVSPSFSSAGNPGLIRFDTAGSQSIALKAFQADGTLSASAWQVTVTSQSAPQAAIQSTNNCAGSPVMFSVNVSDPIQTYDWSFGDGNTSVTANPNHTFATSGNYAVNLTVTAVNTCTNTVQESVTIYNSPVADFTLPLVSPICTNQSYAMINTSTFDVGSSPTWEWRINGNLISTQSSLSAIFTSSSAQELRLKASIPGCQSEMIKTIATVLPGPDISFSAPNTCLGASVSFNNTSSGATGYSWNFGDASSTSTVAQPVHTYALPNVYQVTLTGSSANGCQNFVTHPLQIYSLPKPDFSVGLPPFSCANSSTPFQNNTPPLTDSNVITWGWQFGDTKGGTSALATPSYTYLMAGNYTVTLTAASDAGCQTSISKSITIAQAPVADFSQTPACVNQSTRFTDLSSGGVSRAWQIGTSNFSTATPSYTFSSSGNFNAALSVTSANGCSNVKSKTITVPVAPTLDFALTNSCAGKQTTFTDQSVTGTDPVIGWNWLADGNALTGNPVNYTFSLSGTYVTKLTTTHTSGCQYVLSKNVVINPTPVASFTASPDRGAAPLTVQFTNTSQQATGYNWKFYDKSTANSTRESPVYTFASLGNYSAELTATNAQGCSDIITIPIVVLIPSIDLILTDFSLTTDPITGNLKSSVTIRNNSNIPITYTNVALFLTDKAVVNETVPINLGPGQSITRLLSFTISPGQVSNGFLCAEIQMEKDVQADNNKRCINLATGDYFFAPYPNPTAGTLQVDWISQNAGTATIRIYDNTGKKGYEWQTTTHAGLNQSVLDVSFLTAGLYYLSIETSGSRKTMRFMRQ